MKIGLVSDTHSFLDPSIFDHFRFCDEVWHAGDFGSLELVEEIAAFRPLQGVWGNIDDAGIRAQFPEYLLLERVGHKILLIHIAGSPPRYDKKAKSLITNLKPDILICGHSHILKVLRDSKHNLLYINPGAAGRQGFHRVRTIMRFELNPEGIRNTEVIELGKRGQI